MEAIPEPGIPGVDFALLAAWMDERSLGAGPITGVEQLEGGTQNVLVRFDRDERSYVLRRPPINKRKNSDETMRREARVLGALSGSGVPHPGLIAAESDESIIGAAFYLMEPVNGFTPTIGMPAFHASDPAVRREMGFAFVDAAAALGRVDHVTAGLGDFGRPDGYLERQVPRWRAYLESFGDIGGPWKPNLPGVDEIGRWLEEHRPSSFKPGILHGDFHLGNVMFRYDSSALAAVVDWELATIGDPLLDLGVIAAFWPDADAASTSASDAASNAEPNTPGDANQSLIAVEPWDGFPTTDELVERYAQNSDRDVERVNWYTVLACYKTGIVLEGTYARAQAGKAPMETGEALHATTLNLLARGRAVMERT